MDQQRLFIVLCLLTCLTVLIKLGYTHFYLSEEIIRPTQNHAKPTTCDEASLSGHKVSGILALIESLANCWFGL